MEFKLKYVGFALVFIIAFSALVSSCTTVDASHEGIKVSKIGSDRGASDIEQVTGWIFYNPFTSFIEQYPTFTQTKDYDAFSVTAKGGSPFTIDPTLNYHMIKGQGANVYRKYRKELPDIENNVIRTIIYNSYRDVANTFSPDSIVNNRVAFENLVEGALRNALSKDGFAFENITSNLRPPASLQAMIDAKNTAVQTNLTLQNKVAGERAQAAINIARAEGEARAIVVRAEAEATANRLKQVSLTPLLVQMAWIEAWKEGGSSVPTTVLAGGSNSIYQLPSAK